MSKFKSIDEANNEILYGIFSKLDKITDLFEKDRQGSSGEESAKVREEQGTEKSLPACPSDDDIAEDQNDDYLFYGELIKEVHDTILCTVPIYEEADFIASLIQFSVEKEPDKYVLDDVNSLKDKVECISGIMKDARVKLLQWNIEKLQKQSV